MDDWRCVLICATYTFSPNAGWFQSLTFSSHMLFLFLHLLLIVCVCVYAWVYTHECRFLWSWEEDITYVVLELQVVKSPAWVLGTEVRPFVGAVCTLNLWAISPVPPHMLLIWQFLLLPWQCLISVYYRCTLIQHIVFVVLSSVFLLLFHLLIILGLL